MGGVDRYAWLEAIAIHALTGVLFALLSVLILANTFDRPAICAFALALTAGAAAGWWWQARWCLALLQE